MSIIKKTIFSVKDWKRCAPPKRGDEHWRDGRSAKELAKAWFPRAGVEQVPEELTDLFNSRKETSGMVIEIGEPEFVTRFDQFPGEARNSDLVLWCNMNEKRVLVSIEAKADEPFGETSGDYVDKAIKDNPNSNIQKRYSLLCAGLFDNENEETRAIKYQLLTATAGTIAEAKKYSADYAIFVIHEFTGETTDDKLKLNSDDLNRFVNAISNGTIQEVTVGELVGPIMVHGNEYFSGKTPLYIGKCQRQIR